MRWVGYVVHTGDRRGEYKVSMGGNLMERENLEDLHTDGCITLKWVFKKWDGET